MCDANKMFMTDLIIASCWESEADADVSADYCSALRRGELHYNAAQVKDTRIISLLINNQSILSRGIKSF